MFSLLSIFQTLFWKQISVSWLFKNMPKNWQFVYALIRIGARACLYSICTHLFMCTRTCVALCKCAYKYMYAYLHMYIWAHVQRMRVVVRRHICVCLHASCQVVEVSQHDHVSGGETDAGWRRLVGPPAGTCTRVRWPEIALIGPFSSKIGLPGLLWPDSTKVYSQNVLEREREKKMSCLCTCMYPVVGRLQHLRWI